MQTLLNRDELDVHGLEIHVEAEVLSIDVDLGMIAPGGFEACFTQQEIAEALAQHARVLHGIVQRQAPPPSKALPLAEFVDLDLE